MTLGDNPKKDKGDKGCNPKHMALKGQETRSPNTTPGIPLTLHSGTELQKGDHTKDMRNKALLSAQPLTSCDLGKSL